MILAEIMPEELLQVVSQIDRKKAQAAYNEKMAAERRAQMRALAEKRRYQPKVKVTKKLSFGASRRMVADATMPKTAKSESCAQMFKAGAGVRTKKRVSARIQHGEGMILKTFRFENSRLICVCKSRKF